MDWAKWVSRLPLPKNAFRTRPLAELSLHHFYRLNIKKLARDALSKQLSNNTYLKACCSGAFLNCVSRARPRAELSVHSCN